MSDADTTGPKPRPTASGAPAEPTPKVEPAQKPKPPKAEAPKPEPPKAEAPKPETPSGTGAGGSANVRPVERPASTERPWSVPPQKPVTSDVTPVQRPAKVEAGAKPNPAPAPAPKPAPQPEPVEAPAMRPASAEPAASRAAEGRTPAVKAPVTLRSTGEDGDGVRLRIARIDPWSVMKTALAFSVAFGIILIVVTWLLFGIFSVTGAFDALNRILSSVVSAPGQGQVRIQDAFGIATILGVSTLGAVLNAVVFTVVATLFAFLYNLAARLIGGFEVFLDED